MLYLNVGCGSRFHPDWVNLDLNSNSPYVKAVDISKGIPYPDQTFSMVYHSHLLEHLPKRAALGFLHECHRVLIPGGVIRVVVPDLEQIVRAYLSILDKVIENATELQYDYEWITLELLDQMVREYSGGEMGRYLRQVTVPNMEFVYERIGGEARGIISSAQAKLLTKKMKSNNLQKIKKNCSSVPRLPQKFVDSISYWKRGLQSTGNRTIPYVRRNTSLDVRSLFAL